MSVYTLLGVSVSKNYNTKVLGTIFWFFIKLIPKFSLLGEFTGKSALHLLAPFLNPRVGIIPDNWRT